MYDITMPSFGHVEDVDSQLVFLYSVKDNGYYSAKMYVMEKALEGWTRPEIVRLEMAHKTIIGFYKSLRNMGSNNYIEPVLTQIGYLIDIQMANTFVIYSDLACNNQIGIVSESVVNSHEEYFVNFREMRDILYTDLKNSQIQMSTWINRWIKIRSRKKFLPPNIWELTAEGTQEYLDTLHFALEVSMLYAEKTNIELVDFENSYIKLLVYDILIGEADRSPSNYGCVVNMEKKSARLAPLFDNATLGKPYIPEDYISLNHILLKRSKIAILCKKKFGHKMVDFCKSVLSKREEIFNIIHNTNIINDEGLRDFLFYKVHEGVAIIESIC